MVQLGWQQIVEEVRLDLSSGVGGASCWAQRVGGGGVLVLGPLVSGRWGEDLGPGWPSFLCTWAREVALHRLFVGVIGRAPRGALRDPAKHGGRGVWNMGRGPSDFLKRIDKPRFSQSEELCRQFSERFLEGVLS